MGRSYFIWNGIDCRTMGVNLAGPVAIIRPEERVEHVQIPGRSGDLTLTEGENIYNSYIQTATIQVRGGYRARDVWKWLRGEGYVTFSGEPDKRQKARIIGAITLDKHSHNLDVWVGEIQFYCQPLKEPLEGKTTTVTSSGTAVFNSGDVNEKPRITLTASSTSATIAVGGKTLTITGLTSASSYIIDSEVLEMTDSTGATLLTKNTSGDFPVFAPGSNTITGSGWSSLAIVRRERFL